MPSHAFWFSDKIQNGKEFSFVSQLFGPKRSQSDSASIFTMPFLLPINFQCNLRTFFFFLVAVTVSTFWARAQPYLSLYPQSLTQNWAQNWSSDFGWMMNGGEQEAEDQAVTCREVTRRGNGDRCGWQSRHGEGRVTLAVVCLGPSGDPTDFCSAFFPSSLRSTRRT